MEKRDLKDEYWNYRRLWRARMRRIMRDQPKKDEEGEKKIY